MWLWRGGGEDGGGTGVGLKAPLDPIEERRGLVSGIPKRLCKRIRVDVGCLEVADERDEERSGGGEMGGEG